MDFFFHELTWDSFVVWVLIGWAIIIPVFLWSVRYAYKSGRKTQMKHRGLLIDLCRDIFLRIGGFEYLLVAVILVSIYLGFWAYYTSPSTANWANWETYIVALPQIVLLFVIIILFFIRWTKFRKPYLK
ncbi:hypothetical protein K6V26_13410 [Parabacteroides goldsteinii]|uniref:hypothetical protein n=1 Tax=Parabacteroides goldsteinii TaxID=328812 RepID=UPI001CC9AE9C|nr:hypothetical protein [Parabacteroides goldsteinii]UBD77261.1 hypothetical protein K6V26_13410 [Parabacteroides goldsteinii]